MLVHEHLNVVGNTIYYEKWLFRPDEFPCGSCKDTTNVVFMRLGPLNAVCRSCTFCGVTERIFPRHPRTDVPQAIELQEPRLVTEDEVRAFIKRNKMKAKFLHPVLLRIFERKAKKLINLEDLDLDELD